MSESCSSVSSPDVPLNLLERDDMLVLSGHFLDLVQDTKSENFGK